MNMPGDLNFEQIAEGFVRATAPVSGAVVGFITRGRRTENGCELGGARWYVDGHDYVSFRTLTDAAWALRDYWLGPVLRERVRERLRCNDGNETVVRLMRQPQAERAVFKKESRRTRRYLYDRLALHNAQAGGEYFKTN